jgi:NAD(P)-dependent dehydrogenase (short-subunit alcohol dehydrogenase family)
VKLSDRVVLVTGASSGLGLATARRLHARGYRVYGTSRGAAREAGASADGFALLRMDVDDDASVAAAVAQIVAREGRLDVVSNNAGFGICGAIEDTSSQEALAQLETNFFGLHRVVRAVLPQMRRQRYGYVVNTSSLAGRIALPFQAFYSASKFAVEGYSEALRLEVRAFGIRVALIEPGDFRTGFTARRRFTQASGEASPYHAQMRRTVAIYERDEERGAEVDSVARLFVRIIETDRPRLRHVAGPFAQRLGARLKRHAPDALFERLLASTYELG